MKPPRRPSTNELARVGVTLLSADPLRLECQTCTHRWRVAKVRDRLPRLYWRCPSGGCNEPREPAPLPRMTQAETERLLAAGDYKAIAEGHFFVCHEVAKHLVKLRKIEPDQFDDAVSHGAEVLTQVAAKLPEKTSNAAGWLWRSVKRGTMKAIVAAAEEDKRQQDLPPPIDPHERESLQLALDVCADQLELRIMELACICPHPQPIAAELGISREEVQDNLLLIEQRYRLCRGERMPRGRRYWPEYTDSPTTAA